MKSMQKNMLQDDRVTGESDERTEKTTDTVQCNY